MSPARICTILAWSLLVGSAGGLVAAGWAAGRDVRAANTNARFVGGMHGEGTLWSSELGESPNRPLYVYGGLSFTVRVYGVGDTFTRISTALAVNRVRRAEADGRPGALVEGDEGERVLMRLGLQQARSGCNAGQSAVLAEAAWPPGERWLWGGIAAVAWRASPGLLSASIGCGAAGLAAAVIRRRLPAPAGVCAGCAYPKVAGAVRCPECGADYLMTRGTPSGRGREASVRQAANT